MSTNFHKKVYDIKVCKYVKRGGLETETWEQIKIILELFAQSENRVKQSWLGSLVPIVKSHRHREESAETSNFA